MSGQLRIAFVSGQSQWWRKQRLVAKYLKMRLEGVIYPDVYCLALMLSDKFDFLLEDEKVPRRQVRPHLCRVAELGQSTALPRIAGRSRRPAGGGDSGASGDSFPRPDGCEAAAREAHLVRSVATCGRILRSSRRFATG